MVERTLREVKTIASFIGAKHVEDDKVNNNSMSVASKPRTANAGRAAGSMS